MESTQFLYQSEICCEITLGDLENDTEDKKEVDENEKIHQLQVLTIFSQNLFSEKNISKQTPRCLDVYYDFTTPPPEVEQVS